MPIPTNQDLIPRWRVNPESVVEYARRRGVKRTPDIFSIHSAIKGVLEWFRPNLNTGNPDNCYLGDIVRAILLKALQIQRAQNKKEVQKMSSA